MWADPEAAAIVFDSGMNVTAVGLDVTQDPSACLRREHIVRLAAANTPITNFVAARNLFQIAS